MTLHVHVNRPALAAVAAAAAAATLVTASPAGAAAPASAPAPRPGAPGGGDPFFPRAGNGGYDVRHYRLDVRYVPATKHLAGTATITARATQPLSRFDLDLRPSMTVSSVRVHGRVATFAQPAAQVQELVITPRRALRRGETFTVVVRYAGTATPVVDPDGSLEGIVPTPDGAFVAGEPQGSPSWFPVNDTPRDKATFEIRATVPKGVTAVSNGVLVRRPRTLAGWTTWQWRQKEPMAPYLTTLTMGRFVTSTGRTGGGVPVLNAIDPSQRTKAVPVLNKLPAMVDYFSSVFGRYPFSSVGAIVDDAPKVGYALETQTRPVFDSAPDESTLAHELAHQWFGDSVTLASWPDIWLNEGFAEFSSWLWEEHAGQQSAQKTFESYYAKPATSSIWAPPPTRLTKAEQIFGSSVYVRGAMTLQALRVKLGDPTFFRVLKGWHAAHRYGNATVPQFEAYAQRVSGKDLRAFFATWLETSAKPTSW